MQYQNEKIKKNSQLFLSQFLPFRSGHLEQAICISVTRGVLDISLGVRCSPATHTMTLFKTKIADFPTLFKTDFQFLMPCLSHLPETKKNIILTILTSLVHRTYAQAVYRPRKDTLKRKIPKNFTLAGRTSPLSPYKGGPPRAQFIYYVGIYKSWCAWGSWPHTLFLRK